MCAGMMPILHLPGEMMPGQFGPISREFFVFRNSQVVIMSIAGMPSVMQTMSGIFASAASMMASAAPGGGTKITVALAAVFSRASMTVLKIGQPSCVVPPLPGVTPPTTVVPYAAAFFAWNVPSRPVKPCTNSFVFLSTRMLIAFATPLPSFRNTSVQRNRRDKRQHTAVGSRSSGCCSHSRCRDRSEPRPRPPSSKSLALACGLVCRKEFLLRSSLPLGRGDNLLGRVFHGLCHDKFQSAIFQDLAALFDVRSLQPHHDRQLDVGCTCRTDDAVGQRVDPQDAAKDVDEHCLHVLIAQQDFESMRHLLFVGAAAHVEKVGRHTPCVLNDVHGGHRQAGAVDHAADVAVELDVVQAVLAGLDFKR